MFPDITINLGNDPWAFGWEALAALGTLGAVAWAVRATLLERADRKAAEGDLVKERRAEADRRNLEPARKITVWSQRSEFELETGPPDQPTKIIKYVHVSVFCMNTSETPITNLRFGYENEKGKEYLGDTNVVIRPQEEATSGEALRLRSDLVDATCFIEFNDHVGSRCYRSESGEAHHILREIYPASEAFTFPGESPKKSKVEQVIHKLKTAVSRKNTPKQD